MTESDWIICGDPTVMLTFLRDSGQLSERKARLFGAACSRRVWHLFTDEICRHAVHAGETLADGHGTQEEADRTRRQTWALLGNAEETPSSWVDAVRAAGRVGEPTTDRSVLAASEAASAIAEEAVEQALWAGATAAAAEFRYDQVHQREKVWQCCVLRDLIGNPSRPLALDSRWLARNDGIVKRLADAAYEVRVIPAGTLELGRLAILADALEEAGCSDAEILGHLRSPSPHYRGCHVVDLLLGRT